MTHALYTGPIRGVVTLADGTEVDVEPTVIHLDTLEQAQEAALLIGDRYAAEGHPHHDANTPFVHDRELSESNFAAHRESLEG